MENVSLKQWITAGALSGVVTGILVFFLQLPFVSDVSLKEISFLLILSLINYIFCGLIAGIILFFVYDKLPLKKRLWKCLIISIILVLLMFFIFAYLEPFFIAEFYLKMLYVFSVFVPIPFVPFLLIGVTLGFVINDIINRMEKKMKENTGQT